LILNFINAYPMFRVLLILSPLFFTLIVIGEIKVIFAFAEIIKGVDSEKISDEERSFLIKQSLYYLAYNTSYYFALQLISSAFIYYNMKLYRTVINYYLIKTMNIDKHTYNRMSSGEIKDIIERKAVNIFKIMESVFEKGMYQGTFVIYALYKILSEYGNGMLIYTICTLIVFTIFTSFLIKKRNMIKIKYNAAHAKVSADRYNILTNYDIIKSYNREVEDVNSMDNNLNEMTSCGNISNFLSACSAYASRVSMIMPTGILYFIIMKYNIVSSISTAAQFMTYNTLFCYLRCKLHNFRTELVRLGQYSVDLYSDDYDKMPNDIDNTLLNLLVRANQKVLFSDANFSIKRGEKVALVGKNGTGKSTFLDVLLRFKQYEGYIFVDGKNMNDIYKFDQRSKISYVSQNPGIISGTVLDNLRYHDSTISRNMIEEICSKYGYHELFVNLPDGYDTDVGENGRFLSGGQKQKLSLMRGLIKDGDIFIMDEPTASLDPHSESQVISHIFESMKSKTVITIIHKHSLLSRFDKILGIYNGKI
ncbi:ATP-binding cassette sub-family B member 7, mitochondrial, partial [Nosema bombycis CQ1]